MKKLLLALFACNALVSAASAYNVSFDIEADLLKNSTANGGGAMPTTGICLLVASTTDASFVTTLNAGQSLAVGSFLNGGDDQILFKMDLSTNGTPGVFGENPTINTANFSANLDGNDPLILYWFPTLTTASNTIPATAVPYGQFRTTTTQDGGQSWVMPAATTNNYRLYFKTTDGAIFPGTHDAAESLANLSTAVPEPSTYAVVMLAGLGGVLLRRRLRPA